MTELSELMRLSRLKILESQRSVQNFQPLKNLAEIMREALTSSGSATLMLRPGTVAEELTYELLSISSTEML